MTVSKVSFYALDRFYTLHKASIDTITSEVMASGSYVSGKYTEQLEEKLAQFCQRRYAVTNASGTDSLFFALKALNIGMNDEVLVPALSFIATATAVTRTGAKPVFVDVDCHNALMSMSDAETKISANTKALLFVDLYGNVPDLEAIEKFATKHNLLLIEDAAQAIGCERNNRKAGSMGNVSIFSFDPTKPIGAFGTGGAVLTNNEHIANYCRAARQNGKNNITAYYDRFGINSRLSELQAALIHWQIDGFDETMKQRQQKAHNLIDQLQHTSAEILVKEQLEYSGNFHKMVVACNKRDELSHHLKQQGIETQIHYPQCLYQHPVLQTYKSHCANAELLTKKILTLPFYPELSMEEIEYILFVAMRFIG